MLIWTAKFSRKKAVAAVIVMGVVIAALIALMGRMTPEESTEDKRGWSGPRSAVSPASCGESLLCPGGGASDGGGLSGVRRGYDAGRRPCLSACRPGDFVGGGGERSACHSAGRKISSGEADAGVPGQARAVSGTGADGQFAIGPVTFTGGIPFFNTFGIGKSSEPLTQIQKKTKLHQKGHDFFGEKRKNILHFAETADII